MLTNDAIWQRWVSELKTQFPDHWTRFRQQGYDVNDISTSHVGLKLFINNACTNETQRSSITNHWYNTLHRARHKKTSISVTHQTRQALKSIQTQLELNSVDEVIQELLPVAQSSSQHHALSMTPPDELAVAQLTQRLTPDEQHIVLQLLAWSYKLGSNNPSTDSNNNDRLKRFKRSKVSQLWANSSHYTLIKPFASNEKMNNS